MLVMASSTCSILFSVDLECDNSFLTGAKELIKKYDGHHW